MLNRKSEILKDFLLWGTVLIISIIFFFFVGEKSYVMQKDSHVYTDWIYIRSIMPIYPCFIEFLKWCFGEAGYLDAAVIAQGFISAFCAIDFCLFIKSYS